MRTLFESGAEWRGGEKKSKTRMRAGSWIGEDEKNNGGNWKERRDEGKEIGGLCVIGVYTGCLSCI